MSQILLKNLFKTSFHLVQTLSPNLGARWGLNLFFTPLKYQRPEQEKVLIQNATKEKVVLSTKISQPEMHYMKYSWGEGPAVLLVHGWGGRGSQMAFFAKPLLEAGYKVITFDAFAHGDSSGKQTNLLEISQIIKDIEKATGSFHGIISHSFGGVGAAFAVSEGVETEHFITIGSPASIEYVLKGFMQQTMATKKTMQEIENYIERNFGRKLKDFSLKNLMAKMGKPGLIVHDKNDKEVQYTQAIELSEFWEEGSLLLTENLGHKRILKDPETIQQIVQKINSVAKTNK